MSSPYLVPVAQLLRDVPSSATITFEAPFDEPHEFPPRGPAETDVFPEATVRLQLRLESFNGGLRARGQVEAPWHGVCRRCSTPVLGVSSVSVNERFVDHRVEGDEEVYLIEDDFIDLAPLAHDAIFLELWFTSDLIYDRRRALSFHSTASFVAIQPGWLGVRELGSGAGGVCRGGPGF